MMLKGDSSTLDKCKPHNHNIGRSDCNKERSKEGKQLHYFLFLKPLKKTLIKLKLKNCWMTYSTARPPNRWHSEITQVILGSFGLGS